MLHQRKKSGRQINLILTALRIGGSSVVFAFFDSSDDPLAFGVLRALAAFFAKLLQTGYFSANSDILPSEQLLPANKKDSTQTAN